MYSETVKKIKELLQYNRDVTSIVAVTVLTLSVPIVVMQFSDQVNWTMFDIVVAHCTVTLYWANVRFYCQKTYDYEGGLFLERPYGLYSCLYGQS